MEAKSKVDKSTYWAAAQIEEIADAVMDKYNEWKQYGHRSGYFNRMLSSYRAYYGLDSNGTLHVQRNDRDIAEIKVAHLKSLIKRLHIMITENKLAFQPRAHNSDSKSQIESDLARGIVEYYGDEKNLNGILSQAVLGALVQLEKWVYCPWSLSEGYELTVDGEAIVKSGDQVFELLDAFDVGRAISGAKSPWITIRKRVNKWDEAAMHPEFADVIIAADAAPDDYDLPIAQDSIRGVELVDEDACWKYIFLHSRTPSMPKGRQVEIIGDQVLSDSELRYAELPAFRLTAGDVLSTIFADSPIIDLVPLQEALDAISSSTLTNNLNNANQLIWSADPNLTTRRMGDGQTLVTSASPPQALNLTGSAAENVNLIQSLVQNMQLLSGVNDVARGNPGDSLKSGTSLAVVLAQAIQYVSDLQKNYARLAGDVASMLIANIQRFATEDMTAYIVGASRKGEVKTFKAHDVMNIKRIAVDLGNPLVQSFAGRNELVAQWQQYGLMKDPKAIINFLRTGQLDSETENPFSDSIRARECCEMLRQGQVPLALLTDNHAELIVAAKGIMSGEEARTNPAVVNAFTAFVQQHIDLMRQVPPDLAAVLSGQPLPQPVQPGQPPNPTLPTVDGARMPNTPPGTPPQVQANYQQALNGARQAQPQNDEVA